MKKKAKKTTKKPAKKVTKTKKKGINGRNKGANAERKLAKLFSTWWGSEFTRTPMSGGFATKTFRDDWNASGDLVTPDVDFPFCVESKKVEGWHLEQLLTSPKCIIHKWWQQTLDETPEGKEPLLVFSRNGHPELIMVRGHGNLAVLLWNANQNDESIYVGRMETHIFKLSSLFELDPADVREYYKALKEGENE